MFRHLYNTLVEPSDENREKFTFVDPYAGSGMNVSVNLDTVTEYLTEVFLCAQPNKFILYPYVERFAILFLIYNNNLIFIFF